MKITYSSPNRSHHYPYAEALHRAGCLHAFVCGFSRLSPRAPLPVIGEKMKRHDVLQTIFVACLQHHFPRPITRFFQRKSFERLDHAGYKWARESDVFLYYRTQGLTSTRKLRAEGSSTLCVMEEVNSHIEYGDEILLREFESLNIKGGVFEKETDHYTRLQAYEESDYILCPSEFVRRSFLSKGFAPERLLKVNFGFPAIETGNSKVDKPHHAFRMLYVGQLHYRKGLRYAIEAFRKLNHPNKEFIIVGPKTPITGLENTQIPPGVVFTGTLKGEDLKNEYRKASVFVLPSLEEGLALVQGEALAFGVPLLITTNTGGDDIIENGKEGFIVEPASIDSLADRMQEMADDRFLLERMSANALVTAKTLGSWDIAAGRLISQLSDVLHHKTVNEVIV